MNMKKIFTTFTIALAALFATGMTSCEEAGSKPSVDPDTVSFPAEGGTHMITVTSDSDWTATPGENWISGRVSGNTFEVTVGAATDERSGTVTVSNASGSTVVTVTQEASATPGVSISVNPDSVTFPSEGDSQTVIVTSASDWTVSADEWITATPSESRKSLVISVGASRLERTGTITLSNGTNEATITVTQHGTSFVIGDLVGTWMVTEQRVLRDQSTGQWQYLDNDHALVMTKEGDTKLKITGFAGLSAQPTNLGTQIAYAEFDRSTGMFTLLAGELTPTWVEGFLTYFSGMSEASQDFKDCTGINISAFVEEDLSFRLWSYEQKGAAGGDSHWIAYHISGGDPSTGAWRGLIWYAINSDWKKISDSTDFPPTL